MIQRDMLMGSCGWEYSNGLMDGLTDGYLQMVTENNE